jgi:cyclopropane-fatty-acyl-phospholipid synthase
VDSVGNIGPHYARTLREWRNRFEDKFESDIVPALQKTHRDFMDSPDEFCDKNVTSQVGVNVNARRVKPRVTVDERGEIEVFRRKWIYYL